MTLVHIVDESRTYHDWAKQLSRERWKSAIEQYMHTRNLKPSMIKVVTLAGADKDGEEALSVKEVYLPLGILPANITIVEKYKEEAERLKRWGVVPDVQHRDLEDYVMDPRTANAHLWELDYKGHMTGNVATTLKTIASRGLLGNAGLVFTNFFTQRENTDTQESLKAAYEQYAYLEKMTQYSLESEQQVRGSIREIDRQMQIQNMLQRKYASRQRYQRVGKGLRLVADPNAQREFEAEYARLVEAGKPPVEQTIREHQELLASNADFIKEFRALTGDMPKDLNEARRALTQITLRSFQMAGISQEITTEMDALNDRVCEQMAAQQPADQLQHMKDGAGIYARMFAHHPYQLTNLERYTYRSNKGSNMLVDIFGFERPKELLSKLEEIAIIRNGKSVVNPKNLSVGQYMKKGCEFQLLYGRYARVPPIPEPTFLGSSDEGRTKTPKDKRQEIDKLDAIDLFGQGSNVADVMGKFRVVHDGVELSKFQLAAVLAHVTMGTYEK